jgi:capsular polysaccharide transport system ATP-binding protein
VGDASFRLKASAAFEKLRERASLIFVSHNLRLLRDSCQSALFLREGHVTFYPQIREGIVAYRKYMRRLRAGNIPDPDQPVVPAA